MTDWLDFPFGSEVPLDRLEAVVGRGEHAVTGGYSSEVRVFDFSANGKAFTQVAILFTPEVPIKVDGKDVVIFTSEAGHDSAREFAEDDQGLEGPGPWLARRGITVIATARLGRWNFQTSDPLGSWEGVPLEQRMPVFNRDQPNPWPARAYETRAATGVSSPTGSASVRFPVAGSELEQSMLALTPEVMIEGFQRVLEGCGVKQRRDEILLLYWGFSTGGAFLWPLAKIYRPDGIASFGMAHFAISYFATRGFNGDYRWLYDNSALRVRERNYTDFAFFSPDHSDEQRRAEWVRALRSARFKSFEDTFMFFNVGALTESLTRLWNGSFLPDEVRARGFADLVQKNIELSFPDSSLSDLAVLELSGTKDEIHPPHVIEVAASVTAPYCRKYQQLLLPGLHHSICAHHVKVFGSIWIDAIQSGYFTKAPIGNRGE